MQNPFGRCGRCLKTSLIRHNARQMDKRDACQLCRGKRELHHVHLETGFCDPLRHKTVKEQVFLSNFSILNCHKTEKELS